MREKLGLVAEACNPSQDGIPVVTPTGGKLGKADDGLLSDLSPISKKTDRTFRQRERTIRTRQNRQKGE